MEMRQLEKHQWRPYFDAVSRHLPATQVEIEVAGLDIGDQIQAEWVPLLGITYDPGDDVLEVATEALDHRIPHPQAIHVSDGEGRLWMLRVQDGERREQIVRLKQPLRLQG